MNEKAQKYESLIISQLKRKGLAPCALALNCSESTISRMQGDQLTNLTKLLEALDLKVVASDRVCVREEEYLMMTRIVSRALANEETSRRLFFEDAE